MKIQIFSDTHLEAYSEPKALWDKVHPGADIAVIPGDVCTENFEMAIREISWKFKHVIVVLGNHDYAGQYINWKPSVPENVHVLNNSSVEFDGVVFAGNTLWTNLNNNDWFVMNKVNKLVPDFSDIKNFSTNESVSQNKSHSKFLHDTVRETDKPLVIVTHFLPSYNLITDRWKTVSNEMLNHYFHGNCDHIINDCKPGTVWCFGHTHDRIDTEINDVRFICNPVGYRGYKSQYQHTVIEI